MFGIPVPKARGLPSTLKHPTDSGDSLHDRHATPGLVAGRTLRLARACLALSARPAAAPGRRSSGPRRTGLAAGAGTTSTNVAVPLGEHRRVGLDCGAAFSDDSAPPS